MGVVKYANKVVYYGGYPGSSGKPQAGRLVWRDGVLRFIPRGGGQALFSIERGRLLGVRRSEEGMTGARRVRLLVDVQTEQLGRATVKFEMRAVLRKERDLRRWLEILEPICKKREADDV